MDHRHLIAYSFLLLIVLGLGAAWLFISRDWRSHRRAHFRYERQQSERRDAEVADER
jgi:hypothetical protein